MRALLVCLMLALPAAASFPNGYTNCKIVTVKTQSAGMMSGTTNFTDFPVLISFTDSALAVTGSGGQVQSASGFDIAFDDSWTCSGAGNALNWEQERWISTTGEVIYHARFPTLHYAFDDRVSMYYGKSGVSSFQGGGTTAWNSAYKGVYHLAAVASVVDATGNNSAGSNTSGSNTTGQVDGGVSFGGGGNHLTIGSGAALQQSVFTYESWVNPTSLSSIGPVIGCSATTNCPSFVYLTTGVLKLLKQGVTPIGTATNTAMTTGTWYHVAVTYDASGNYIFYLNGAAAGSGTNLQTFSFTGSATLGWDNNGADSMNGKMDEFRLSNVVRSADWIATGYRNQLSPSTYISEGTQLTSPLPSAIRHRATQGGM